MTAATAERRYFPRGVGYPGRLASPSRSGRVSDVALIIILLCISGDPAALWLAGKETTYAVVAVLLAFALILSRGLGSRAVRAFVPIGFIFVTLSMVHAYTFDFFPLVSEIGFLTRLFIGMAVVILVSDFVRAYVLAMVGLASLSLLFWMPEYIGLRVGIHLHDFFRTFASKFGPQLVDRWSLGFHTYLLDPQQMHRNSGIFWEPGVLAGYSIIAILMLAVLRPSLTRKQHLAMLCILTLALISTFSTTGYIACPIVLLLNYDWRGVNRGRKADRLLLVCVVAPLVIFGSLYTFSRVDFLQAKIRKQITAVERREYGWKISRFGTLVYSWQYISGRPLTGWGLHQKTNVTLDPRVSSDGFGNGMSSFIVAFGAVGFGVFLFGLVRGAKHIGGRSRGYTLVFVASIMVLLQGEPFLSYPLFLGLMFLGHASVRGQRLRKFRLVESGSPVLLHYCSPLQESKL